MQLLHNIPGFIATALLLAMVPGQGVAMVLRQSILGGKTIAFLSVLGNSSGFIVWGALSAVGLSAIFATNSAAYEVLKWTGVVFLVGLSLQTFLQLRNSEGKFTLNASVDTSHVAAYRTGILTSLTNVKAAVFAVGFIPAFVPPGYSLRSGIFIFALLWALTSLSWYSFLISVVDRAERYLSQAKVRRTLTALSGCGILFLAIGLALSR